MRRVSLVLLGTVAFSIVSAGIASAADLPPRPTPLPAVAPVVVPVFTWSGCYIGAHGGYGFGTKKFTNVQGVDFTDHDVTGGVAGGQVGCNIQTGVFVFGVEGDASWAGLKGDSPVADVSTTPLLQPGKYNSKVEALGTIAAKFGFAVDRALLYGKVGGAFALDKHWVTLDSDGSTLVSTSSYSRWGWMAGAGAEYAFTPNWSIKAEYNYLGLGKKSPDFCDVTCQTGISISQNVHVVKAGINFRFGGR